MSAILLSGVSYTYPARRKQAARQALVDLALTVAPAEMVALLGPNGSGKSTLLRLLMTLRKPQGGTVEVAGHRLPEEADQVRRRIGVVFQHPALDERLTVDENLQASGRLYGLGGDGLQARIGTLLEQMGLGERRGERVGQLSGGLARRVELAKALLPAPQVLIMDEPTTGLDPGGRRDFWRLVEARRRQDPMAIVVTTHLMDEAQGCDRVAILHEGRLLACDRPAALQAGVGRQVLSLEAEAPEELAEALQRELGLEGRVGEQAVHIPLAESISIDGLAQRFGSRIRAIRLAQPSLDDVFLHYTGRSLAGDEE